MDKKRWPWMRGKVVFGLVIIVVLFFSIIKATALPLNSVFQDETTEYNFNVTPSETLKGWYRFEETQNDYSGNSYHGIVYGNPTLVSGVVNKAYEFDGIDDYILISDYYPDYPIYGDDQSFTVTAWVKTSDISGNHWVIGNEKGWSMFLFGLKDGKLVLYWRYGPSSTTMCLDTELTIAGDEFNHITGVYDASTRNVYIYINGELAASDTTTKPLGIKVKESFTIGRGMSQNTGEMFNGIIDELRIYNIPLSPEEIQFLGSELHRDTEPPSNSDLSGNAGSSVHINLNWTDSEDNNSIAGYRILRDGKELAFLDKTEYVDYEVSHGNNYSYTICPYDNSGNESRSSTITVQTPSANIIHPRMFFTSEEISDIQEKAGTTHASICEKVIDKADGLLSTEIPEYPGVSGDYSKYAENPLALSFAYLMTGDNRYRNRAKEYLLEYSSWPSWGDDSAVTERDYPMAYMTIGVALGYDWIYEFLSENERNIIRTAIGTHIQELYEASSGPQKPEWYNWWRRSYVQNHFTQCISAIGIGSLVLEGEDARSSEWLAHAIEQSLRTKAIYDGIDDGSWHEGIYYQHSGQFTWVVPFYHVLEQNKGINLYSDTYFQNYLYWALYNYRPKSNLPVLPFGSYVPGWGGWTTVGSFAFPRSIDARYRTGHGVWLTEQLIPYTARNQWHSIGYIFEFFYYDHTLEAVEPDDLPLSRTFTDAEAVIWRTGWDDDALIFGLKTGPYGGRFVYDSYFNQQYPFEQRDVEINVGHDHQCAGTFYLYKGAADLASEMPDRHNNTLGESVHNVIMIDGQGQYKANYDNGYFPDTDGKLELSYGSRGYDYLLTDLKNCYREKNDDNIRSPGEWKVNEYKRHVLFVRPGYLIMLDNLSSDVPHQYDWVCHFSEEPEVTTVVEGDWIKSTINDEENNVLGIKVLSPVGFNYEFGESEHPYSGNPPKTKPYIHIRPESNVSDTQFVTVFYPTTSTLWDEKPEISILENNGESVLVRVNQNGIQEHIIRYGSNELVESGEYHLSGQNMSINEDIFGNLQSVFLGNAKYLADNEGDRVLIDSNSNISIELNYSEDKLYISGDSPKSITIYAPEIQEVFWNDNPIMFRRQGDYIYIMKDSPEIISSPVSQTRAAGNNVSFSVEAEGADLEYQWQRDVGNGFENISGETDTILRINDIQKDDEGKYRVIVSNNLGEVVSRAANLIILDALPEISNFRCIPEYDMVYLSWKNPEGQGESWDNLIIKRVEGNIENPEYEDGIEIYEGKETKYIDRNLSRRKYTYTAFTYRDFDSERIYSKPCTTTAEIEDTGHELLRIYPGEENSLLIGQNTAGDLYSLWDEEMITIGRGPTGNETSIWIYSDLIGNGENQIPVESEVLSARLVFSVEDCSFNDYLPIEYIEDDGNDFDQFSIIYEDSRSIEIYQITDPDELGMPHYAKESGIRTGLDHEYRDHRPGVNKPWIDEIDNENNEDIENSDRAADIGSNIDRLFTEQEPLDIIGLNTEILGNKLLDSIQFDITEAVQSWVNEGEDGEENQGLYITTGQDWNNEEVLKVYGISAKESEEQQEYGQSLRPYLEIVFVNSGSSSDITAPEPVQDVKITQAQEPDTDSITLSWTNPEDIDFAGVKILRSEGMVPFSHMDGDFTVFVTNENETNESYTDSGLTPGQAYYYALYAYDEEHNYSEKTWIKGTPGSLAAPTFSGSPTISTGTVTLHWNTVSGAEGYRLYRKFDSGDLDPEDNSANVNPEYLSGNLKCIELKDGSVNSYNDYLHLGTYTYWLTTVNEYGEGFESSEVVVEIGEDNKTAEEPEVPTEFTGESISGSGVKLSWTDNSNNESGFVIERLKEIGEWKEIFTTVYNVTEYIDRGLKPGTVYQYRIKAVNSAGESDYKEYQVMTEGIAGISWQVISASQVKVSWEVVQNASFKVELLDKEGNVLVEQSSNTNYCYFVRLEPDTEYKVKVTVIIGGEEKYSIESDIIRTSADPKGGLF